MGQDVPVFTTTISVARLRDIIDAPNVVILDARFSLDDEQWGKQAYAFVHMCLYGRGLKYQKPFLQFITRLDREPLSEALFKEIGRAHV